MRVPVGVLAQELPVQLFGPARHRLDGEEAPGTRAAPRAHLGGTRTVFDPVREAGSPARFS